MTDLNSQLLCLLDEMKEEVNNYSARYHQKTSQILDDIALLDAKLHQTPINDEIIGQI